MGNVSGTAGYDRGSNGRAGYIENGRTSLRPLRASDMCICYIELAVKAAGGTPYPQQCNNKSSGGSGAGLEQ